MTENMNIATITIGGEKANLMVAGPREFKTGSRGYNANGKGEFGGKKYQININIVEIGSKPKKEK